MNHLESVRTLLIEHCLNENSELGAGMDNHKVYDAFFNLINDPAQSPESIISVLDTFTSELDGFSTNMFIQSLIALACFDGLAKRRPKVINGSWETLVWVIVKYSSHPIISSNYQFRINSYNTNEFIIDFCSPELCLNPCLRLELLRFIRIFYSYCGDFKIDYDLKPFRDNIIKAICEACDYYQFLTIDQIPNVNPIDLQYIIEQYDINLGYVAGSCDLDDYHLETRNTKIIPAFLQLTKKFILIEKEKHQSFNNQPREHGIEHDTIEKQSSACLCFCGLIPEDCDLKIVDKCFDEMNLVLCNDSLLQNYLIDILDTITQILLSLPGLYLGPQIEYMKENLLSGFIKEHINHYPSFQLLYEINGGLNPNKENRLKYFQNNVAKNYYVSDCDPDDIDSYITDDTEYTDFDMGYTDSGTDTEENDLDINISE